MECESKETVDLESLRAKAKLLQSIIGSSDISEVTITRVLLEFNNDSNAALNHILDSPSSHLAVQKTVTSTGGSRISTLQVNPPKESEKNESLLVENGGFEEEGCLKKRKIEGFGEEKKEGFKVDEMKSEMKCEGKVGVSRVKEEPCEDIENKSLGLVEDKVLGGESRENRRLRFQEWLKSQENGDSTAKEEKNLEINDGVKVENVVRLEPNEGTENKSSVLAEENVLSSQENGVSATKDEKKPELKVEKRVKTEPNEGSDITSAITIKEDAKVLMDVQPLNSRRLSDDEYQRLQMRNSYNKPKKESGNETRLSTVVIEDGEFPEDPDWFLVGRTVITGTSTTKGRKLENNEIVHFAFPQYEYRRGYISAKTANALSNIVRFSTIRSGEIGRLPMEWAKCLSPLVHSSKVKVLGRCVSAPVNLQLMQSIMLYVSFYIHKSIFVMADGSSWKLQPSIIDTATYPLLTLFRLLKIIPSQKAEFTPDEFDSRKRSIKIDDDPEDTETVLPLIKRRKGCELPDQNKDEQSISEASLNKLVGAADFYNLEEMEPPATLTCVLKPYQKQALYWMSKLESGTNVEESGTTLHPCWAAYRVCDQRAPAIYVNIFSGEATIQFPSTTQTARGGILADAMGLGKTVMTIALILARRGRGSPLGHQEEARAEYSRTRQRVPTTDPSGKVKGGTLIICPMALLSQWKDELETHSEPDSLSIFVHYGGDRTNDPRTIATADVVLTTYGVLTSACKSGVENSIFHRVEWHRVVLDEAHIIKSSKTQGAQAAFALSSYCRWCITGTPLQNNLEDLYSLLCFLHVEPWCNWEWWSKLIQRPYENGDNRGLKLVKGILRSLMLRRTKESKDKQGRPILVLPPTDIKTIECEKSELEHQFYDALFTRSKIQFDQFVAEGRVLNNYANILELLLRLRQCCNHPLLVMRKASTKQYADLNELAKKFLQNNPNTSQTGPSPAYVKEVVKNLQTGQNVECPICLELPDDPVLTPCAHRMCRECLLFSWKNGATGDCPICRQMLRKTDLVTCPSGGKCRVDVESNWKESSKISKLVECLENIRFSGEKSIVFSQWTSFLDILEIALHKRKIGFLRYDGKVVQKDRERILHEFGETKEKTVLLMSLKTGGVGLNLTAASNVFLMDPWWNPAVEEQAIMRVHRIGQKRTVRVRRFIVKDTVEERLQQVQARKQRMIAGALTDEEVRSTRLEELKMLFK